MNNNVPDYDYELDSTTTEPDYDYGLDQDTKVELGNNRWSLYDYPFDLGKSQVENDKNMRFLLQGDFSSTYSIFFCVDKFTFESSL